VEIQARRRGRGTYYYLTHSYRENGKVRKIEKYLGTTKPTDVGSLSAELRQELFSRHFEPLLAQLRGDYLANLRKMPRSVREKELESFAIQFTYDSNRIEGSSLTLRETSLLILDGLTPSNRPLSDVLETLAHQRVFLEALRKTPELDLDALLEWHSEMFKLTKPRLAGKVRKYGVRIAGSKFTPPTPIEQDFLLRDFFKWFGAAWKDLHPVILAGLVHLKLVTIHPFGDGNGRVTRIAMNYVLHRKRYPMIDIPYTRRAGYYRALEQSQVRKDETVFTRWFLRRYLDENARSAQN
jgi:Fic family protein